MHLAHIKFVSTDVSELCFEWQITRAEQYAKEAPCVSAARARSCSLLHWNKLRERARVISQSRDFTIRRHDGNENVKNNNRFSRQNNNFAGESHSFCAFLCRFCTTTTWNCLILLFREDVNKRRRNFILFLHVNMVLRNSTPGGFAYIWLSIKWVGVIVLKTERRKIQIWSDVFAAVALSVR